MSKPRKPSRANRVASMSREAVGIVGHGAFATALASFLSGCDLGAVMFTGDELARIEINKLKKSPRLPGVVLAKKVIAIDDPAELAEVCRLIVVAVSSREVDVVLDVLAPHLDDRHTVAHAIGALAAGDRRVSQLIRAQTQVTRIAALAGPALPADLVAKRSSALVVAADAAATLDEVKRVLHQPPVLRIYKSHDLAGVELASALSGALTVVLGMADGAGLGHGPRTVLITRAVAEMATLVGASGGDLRTAYGMAGLGNLLARSAPVAAEASREYRIGLAIGRGRPPASREIAGLRALATGCRLAELLGVAAPIFRVCGDLVAGKLDIDDATEQLTAVETDHE